MILVDTSAWIELLRATVHPAHVTLRHHLERRASIAATEPVIMELLAGRAPLNDPLPRLTVRGLADFEAAADRDFDVLARPTRLRIERYRTLRPVR